MHHTPVFLFFLLRAGCTLFYFFPGQGAPTCPTALRFGELGSSTVVGKLTFSTFSAFNLVRGHPLVPQPSVFTWGKQEGRVTHPFFFYF